MLCNHQRLRVSILTTASLVSTRTNRAILREGYLSASNLVFKCRDAHPGLQEYHVGRSFERLQSAGKYYSVWILHTQSPPKTLQLPGWRCESRHDFLLCRGWERRMISRSARKRANLFHMFTASSSLTRRSSLSRSSLPSSSFSHW